MNYLLRQLQVLLSVTGDICRTPISSLGTVMVIAVAMSIPCFAYVGFKSLDQWENTWQGRPQLTLFLKQNIDPNEARLIFEEVQLQPSVARAELISPDQALGEFALLSQTSNALVDFATELEFLGQNPLPFSIVLMPKLSDADPASVTALQSQLAKIDGIDHINLDLDWVAKFAAIKQLLSELALVAAIILAFGLCLIVGNTIKLIIINRRPEIEIMKLVGATNRFVRRPFLYFGALFGLAGAISALLVVAAAGLFVQESNLLMQTAFNSDSLFYSLTMRDASIILAVGLILGWVSARLSVAQNLARIKPR